MLVKLNHSEHASISTCGVGWKNKQTIWFASQLNTNTKGKKKKKNDVMPWDEMGAERCSHFIYHPVKPFSSWVLFSVWLDLVSPYNNPIGGHWSIHMDEHNETFQRIKCNWMTISVKMHLANWMTLYRNPFAITWKTKHTNLSRSEHSPSKMDCIEKEYPYTYQITLFNQMLPQLQLAVTSNPSRKQIKTQLNKLQHISINKML